MASFDQSTRPLRLFISGVEDTALVLTRFSGTEELSRLYRFSIEFVCDAEEPLTFSQLLGKQVHIELHQGPDRVRHIHGLISRLIQGEKTDRFLYFQAEVVPPLWLMTLNKQSRIFHEDGQQAVPDILKTVIGGLYTPDVKHLVGVYPQRNFTVQYQETDFDFISRLMEEEGIYYYFLQEKNKQTLVLADEPDGHLPLPVSDQLIFEHDSVDEASSGRIQTWNKMQQLRVGAVVVSDHNFEMPKNRLELTGFGIDSTKVGTVEHTLSNSLTDNTAVIDPFAGYAWWLDGVSRGGSPNAKNLQGLFQESSRVASLRTDLDSSESLRIAGTSTCRWLCPGHRFTLSGHFDADGDYVLVSVTHSARLGPNVASGSEQFVYSNQFTCMPRSLPFRPAKLTARPVIRGTQTATVVGSEGAEIDPDQYGRVKVYFRWDPAASRGLNTSCWVRVAQFWAGRQWGAQFIPRVGDEVVVAFVEGDPNRPIIIGSVYNADNLPIYPLPKNKTQSGIKTHSSLNGKSSNYNELMFEDKSGQELIRLHAERDMTHHVENSLTQTVGSSAQSSGADVKQYGRSTTQVYGDTSLSVTDGDYSVSVGKGKASVVVNKTIEVTSSTDYIHVTSPKQINLNVDGNAIVDITPGQIKLSVGKSTFITMTDDTIHLEAANIKINGTSTAKIETPSLDCFGKDSNIHGATMKFQGTSNAKVISPEISVTGSTNVTITGGTTAEIALKGTAELKGSTMKVSSPGITTIGGSMVKVNC